MSLKKSRTIGALINREIKRQADKHTDNFSYLKSMGLGMTKTFNINTYKCCCFYWSFNEKLEYFIKTCTQSWKNDIVIISISFNKLYLYERRIKNMKRFLILHTSGLLMSTYKPLCNLQTIFVAEIVRKKRPRKGGTIFEKGRHS